MPQTQRFLRLDKMRFLWNLPRQVLSSAIVLRHNQIATDNELSTGRHNMRRLEHLCTVHALLRCFTSLCTVHAWISPLRTGICGFRTSYSAESRCCCRSASAPFCVSNTAAGRFACSRCCICRPAGDSADFCCVRFLSFLPQGVCRLLSVSFCHACSRIMFLFLLRLS